MKIVLKYISIITILLFIVSCSKNDDVIDIEQTTSSFIFEAVTNSPQIISFTNTSENAENYEWNFGDGTEESFEKHPSHTYAESGTYTVILKAINQGSESLISQELTVLGNPIADFSYNLDSSIPFKVNFQNSSQNTDIYTWSFGNDSGVSNQINPSYTYASEGVYTVTLTSEGVGGSKITTKEIEVTKLVPPYSHLYIVGDGSPSGWNIASPEAFTQDSVNPFVFVYEGLLTPGAFKISTFSGDWCDGNWINSPQDGYDLTNTDYIITNNCDGPDNKWAVTSNAQGNYRITINLSDETIIFELQ